MIRRAAATPPTTEGGNEMVRFTSKNKNTATFIQMARLRSFLESGASKRDKEEEIEAALKARIITQEEAEDLAAEFIALIEKMAK